MGDPPHALFASVHLGSPQGIGARLAIDGCRGVLKARGIGHVTDHVVRQQLEGIRGAVGEALAEGAEELVDFSLTVGVAPCTQDTDRLVTGPQRLSERRVTVVQRELRVLERGCDPRQKVLVVAHAFMMLPAGRSGMHPSSVCLSAALSSPGPDPWRPSWCPSRL